LYNQARRHGAINRSIIDAHGDGNGDSDSSRSAVLQFTLPVEAQEV